jgi:hypothetical protein
MKSLTSLKCVLPLSAVLAMTGALLLATGCGSSPTLPKILGGSYTNASLKGQYVISQTGIGVNQQGTGVNPFSESIVFTADGTGNLTVAVDDFNQTGTLFEDTNLSGTYSISKDGTGSLTVKFTSGSANYAITMIDDSHFYIIQQDLAATASGYGEKQDTTAFATVPSGNFVFKAHNLTTSSRVGGVSVTGGAISGNEDRLNLGSPSLNEPISGSFSATLPDANGRGTLTLTDSGGSPTFYYFVVSTGKIRFLSNAGTLEIGQAEAQSGSFSLATLATGSSYVFGSGGDTTVSGTAGIHSAGVFSSDGNGHITGGTVDYVQDATIHSNVTVSGGSYTLDSTGHGQIALTLSGDVISPQIFWMVNGTRAYFLVDSSAAVEDGTFTVQQPPPLNPVATQSAFIMDGFDAAYKDRVGAFQPTTGNNFNWNQSVNSFDTSVFPPVATLTSVGTNGSFQATSNGRVTVNVNGVSPNLVFYFSSGSSGFMVQEDTNTLGGVNDIGGAFSTQASQ